MKSKTILLICYASVLCSCSFNKMFLKPTKAPENVRKLTLRSASDSTIITFSDATFQPTFVTNTTDTNKFNFTIESVVFRSSNGNMLNGWLLKSKAKIPTATILHFHGNAGFLLSQYSRMTPLLSYGFQIFMFDYSGYGFSEGKLSRKNILADANSALTYVKSRSDVNRKKLIIYGQSLGGHLAAVVASKREKEIDGLVIEGAFSSHKDIAANTAGVLGRLLVKEDYSAYKSIQKYKKPVLIIHSIEDKVIPFRMGKKLYDRANAPKEFFEIRECHICGPQYYADSIANRIIGILK